MTRVFKEVLKDMMYHYVRKEYRLAFLEELYTLTNKYGGSTLWGAVQDVLEEYKTGSKPND